MYIDNFEQYLTIDPKNKTDIMRLSDITQSSKESGILVAFCSQNQVLKNIHKVKWTQSVADYLGSIKTELEDIDCKELWIYVLYTDDQLIISDIYTRIKRVQNDLKYTIKFEGLKGKIPRYQLFFDYPLFTNRSIWIKVVLAIFYILTSVVILAVGIVLIDIFVVEILERDPGGFFGTRVIQIIVSIFILGVLGGTPFLTNTYYIMRYFIFQQEEPGLDQLDGITNLNLKKTRILVLVFYLFFTGVGILFLLRDAADVNSTTLVVYLLLILISSLIIQTSLVPKKIDDGELNLFIRTISHDDQSNKGYYVELNHYQYNQPIKSTIFNAYSLTQLQSIVIFFMGYWVVGFILSILEAVFSVLFLGIEDYDLLGNIGAGVGVLVLSIFAMAVPLVLVARKCRDYYKIKQQILQHIQIQVDGTNRNNFLALSELEKIRSQNSVSWISLLSTSLGRGGILSTLLYLSENVIATIL